MRNLHLLKLSMPPSASAAGTFLLSLSSDMPLCNTLLLVLVLVLVLNLNIQVLFLGIFTGCQYLGSGRAGELVECWHSGCDGSSGWTRTCAHSIRSLL